MGEGQRAFRFTLAAFVLSLAALPLALVFRAPILLAVLGPPVVVVGLTWFVLHRRCSRGGAWTGPVAWALVTLLGAWCIVAGFAGALYAMPAFSMLVPAVANTPRAT